MPNPAPIIEVTGRVHSIVDRNVEAAEAREAERDPETGRIVRQAFEARDGYLVLDVTILTDEGGFATVSILPDAAEAMEGEIPVPKDDVSYPCRTFVSWSRAGSRSFPRVGFSLAGDVLAARGSKPAGSRVALASTGS